MRYIPSFEEIYKIARQSECIRRKYGVMIVAGHSNLKLTGYNARVGKCCSGTDCVRNRLDIKHGSNTDAGAEIHAEQAALLAPALYEAIESRVYLAGLDRNGNPLKGLENGPCYSCARALTFRGHKWVLIPNDDFSDWQAFSIAELMETWEQSWETIE